MRLRWSKVTCICCGFLGVVDEFGEQWRELTSQERDYVRGTEAGGTLEPRGAFGTRESEILWFRCQQEQSWRTSRGERSVVPLKGKWAYSVLCQGRRCRQYFRYDPGYTAPEHVAIRQNHRAATLAGRNFWVAVAAAVFSAIAAGIAIYHLCYGM